jgi:hypothetical protein
MTNSTHVMNEDTGSAGKLTDSSSSRHGTSTPHSGFDR